MPKVRRQYTGGAVATTIAAPLGATGVTTFNVAGGITPSGWPTATGIPFYVVVSPQTSSEEKMFVTMSGPTLTVVSRGADGTNPASHSTGAAIYPVFTAVDADESNELTAAYANQGSLVYQGTSTFQELAISGTSGSVLRVDGGIPAWGQVAEAGIATGAVTVNKIGPLAVSSDKIQSAAITAAKLNNGSTGDVALITVSGSAPTTQGKNGDIWIVV